MCVNTVSFVSKYNQIKIYKKILIFRIMERNRKFIYEIIEITPKTEELIENLKYLEVNYQIIGFNLDENNKYKYIYGFLYFKNARSVKNIKKVTGIETIKVTLENQYSIYKKINNMDSFWEKGNIINKSKNKYESNNPMSFIMNQNQQLLEHTFEQHQLLLEQNKLLIEENNRLKQSHNQNTLCVSTNNANSNNTALSNNSISNNANNSTNSHNKTFNINMFLNNECKDAITLTDFVKNIQIENDDLFYAKEHGFAEAIIRLLENGLKNYDVTERPLHCTDTKRETMHIKNETGWHKEIGSKSEDFSKAIKSLSRKKMDKVSKYINTEGKCEFASKKFEENLVMMREVANGVAYPENHVKKIVKNLVNSVKLEKS